MYIYWVIKTKLNPYYFYKNIWVLFFFGQPVYIYIYIYTSTYSFQLILEQIVTQAISSRARTWFGYSIFYDNT